MRQKTSTYQRWMNTTDLKDLMREAENLSRTPDVNPGVIHTLYAVIMRKAIAMKPIALDCLVTVMPTYQALRKNDLSYHFKQSNVEFGRTHNTAINYALLCRNYDAFEKLLELR